MVSILNIFTHSHQVADFTADDLQASQYCIHDFMYCTLYMHNHISTACLPSYKPICIHLNIAQIIVAQKQTDLLTRIWYNDNKK